MWDYLQRNRIRLEIGAVVVACFGPYLATGWGLRSEHVVLYVLSILAIPVVARRMPRRLWPLPWLWVALTTVVAVQGINPPSPAEGDGGLYLAGLDNVTLPLATGAIALSWLLRGWNAERVMAAITTLLVPLLALNTVVMLFFHFGEVPLIGRWWTSSGLTDTTAVAGRAAELGRLTGIFNQPLEAGIAYSIGILLAAHWSHRHQPTVTRSAIVAVMLAGGLLTTSKVFIGLGIPMALILTLWLRRDGLVGALMKITIFAAPILVVLSWTEWDGLKRLLGIITFDVGQRSPLYYYTAGRYGAEGNVGPVVDQVMRGSPLFGFGAVGLPVPSDNAYVEILVMAGLVGMGLYVLVLAMLMVANLRLHPSPDKALSMALIALTIIAGFGGPTITANRAGVFLVACLVTAVGGSQVRTSSLAGKRPLARLSRLPGD